MAASPSFSSAGAFGTCSRCCLLASAAGHSTSSLSSAASCRAGANFSFGFNQGRKRVGVALQSNPSGSPSSSSLRLRLLPRCNSVSDDDASTSSSTSTPPTPSSAPWESSSQEGEGSGQLLPPSSVPTPSSAPWESSSQEGEESGQLPPRAQQRKRRAQRREADSTDKISSSLSRRFGLAGGLAWVGFLAFGVISEQIKTRTEVFLESQGTQDVEGSATEVELDNNVKYVDVRTGGGSSPLKGDLVLLDLTGKLRSTGEVFVDTTSSKRPLAFVYGLKPYPRGVCYGLEYVLQSMKAGGKRKVTVPADQCFGDAGEDLGNGAVVPGGAEIEYEVELQKVSIAPS